MVRRELIFRRVHLVIFGSVIIQKKTTYGIDIGSTKTHDLPVGEMTSWHVMTWCLPNLVDAHKSQTSCGFHRLTSACCVIISRRGPLKILRLSHHDFSAEFDNGWIRGIAETCGSSDGWTFSPDTRWEKKGPWRSLQRETFVIPTSQLKTATHIFRNLNRWKIDRNGHDLDLARQRAAGCGCCWSLGRCTTGQACQPLFNFGFVFFSHRF